MLAHALYVMEQGGNQQLMACLFAVMPVAHILKVSMCYQKHYTTEQRRSGLEQGGCIDGCGYTLTKEEWDNETRT